jgi:hypothetical protein
MKSQAYAGSALVALGVATGSLLAPQPASALDFDFSFGSVSGLISGLVNDTANQIGGVTVSVSNSGGIGAATGPYLQTGGLGFTVSSGVISFADFTSGNDFPGPGDFLSLQSAGSCSSFLACGGRLGAASGWGLVGEITYTLRSSSPSSVPGPLPLFGAAAAFGFSRKLRNRIKCSANALSITPSA